MKSEATEQKPASSEKLQEKINEVRGLLGSLTEEMRSFLTDTTIRRFLRARDWSTVQATKGLKETVKWRREYKPEAIRWEDILEKDNEIRRTHVADYLDKNGRSVLITNVSMKSKVAAKEQIKLLVYILEYLATTSAAGEDDCVVWLTDFQGWTISNTPLTTTRESMHIIQNYYPGIIAAVIALNPPRIFESFWNIAKHFADPKMKEKVKFVYLKDQESQKIIADIFDLDKLESSFGGRRTAAFDINEQAERMRRSDHMHASCFDASKDANGYN